jgi:hypothetical protein
VFRFVIHYVGIADISKVGIVATLLVDVFFLPSFGHDWVTRRRIILPILLRSSSANCTSEGRQRGILDALLSEALVNRRPYRWVLPCS